MIQIIKCRCCGSELARTDGSDIITGNAILTRNTRLICVVCRSEQFLAVKIPEKKELTSANGNGLNEDAKKEKIAVGS